MKVLVVVLSVVAVASAGYLANPGLLTDGLLSRGIVAPGLLGRGLVAPGLVGSGLVAPGIVGSGLVAPGLLGRGLVTPGLVAPGLVAAPAVRLIPGGPANIVIGPGGVPLDTPEVTAAKGAHAVAVAQTRVRDALINPAPLGLAAAHGLVASSGLVAASGVIAAPSVVDARAILGVSGVVLGPGGVPLDTPEVAAAKAANAAAHLEAKARVGLIH